MKRERATAILQTLAILIALSLVTVLTKLALHDVAPLTFATLSIAVGGVALSIYTFGMRRERIPSGLGRRVWIYLIAIGICNFAIGRIAATLALQRMPATTNTFLTNFIGFITMGMSIFILQETPTIFQFAGAVVAIGGLRIFFAVMPSHYELVGILLVVISITAIAYTNNAARKLAIITNYGLSNNIISSVTLLIGGSIAVVIGLALNWPPHVPGMGNWAIIVFAGVVMIAIGLTVWNYVLRTLRSYEASLLGASGVVWTTLLAVPLLGEHISVNQLAGMGLMILGLALVQVRRG